MDRETDRIMLRELRLECVIGVGEDERCQPQELLLDLELEVDLSLPGRTDDLADTVDYGALAKRIRSAVGNTTPTQTLSGAVDIVVTGATATSAGDLTFVAVIVEALN